MNPAQLQREIKDLSTADKLRLIEALWTSISPETLAAEPFEAEELEELERRARRLADDPTSGVALAELDEFLSRP